MKKFSFNMEKVLKLRSYREQEAKLELGRAVGTLSQIEMNIKSVAEERVRAASYQFAPENNSAEIMQYSFYLMRLDAAKEKLLGDAAAAELKVEETRAVYLEASRESKVLEKLKEKKEAEYSKMMFAEETKLLDDLASGTRARRLAEGL